MNNSISIFGLTFHLYGLIIGVAMATAYTLTQRLVEKMYPQGEITAKDIDQSFWWLVGGGLIGARLYHVIDYWGYYGGHPAEIPAVWQGGLGIYGAVAGGLLGAMVWNWRKKKLVYLLDAVAVNMLLAQAMGRWGNYFNQELYGYPTNLPWGIYIEPAHRLRGFEEIAYYHPLFLYEMIWNLIGFGILRHWAEKRKLVTGKGNYLVTYLAWYALGRMGLELLKITPAESSKTMAIRVSAVIMIVTTVIFVYRKRRHEWTVLAD